MTDVPDDAPERELHPLDYVTADAIHDLWGIGYTIVKRARHPDPFFVPPEVVPQGRSYQWMHLVEDKFHYQNGWAAVPNSRHDGMFMPFGTGGNIEVSGLGLFEKPKFEVDQERANQIEAAKEPLKKWAEQNSMFDGGARITEIYDNETRVTTVMPKDGTAEVDRILHEASFAREDTKTLETTSAIPREMTPYIGIIFKERDRLRDEIVRPDRSLEPGPIAEKFYAAVDADKSLPWWPTLHAILLPIAIENVRKSLKESES